MKLSGNLEGTSLLSLGGSRVRSLDLSGCEGVAPDVLETLRGAPIAKLSLFGCSSVGDGCMESLAMIALPLSQLDIGETKVGDGGLRAVQGIPSLSALFFRGLDDMVVTEAGIVCLRNLPLTFLEMGMGGRDWSDELNLNCISELRGLNLTHLSLFGNGTLTDEGFSVLEGMLLTSLELTETFKITKGSTTLLKGMPLQKLSLDFGRGNGFLSDECWEILGALPLTSLKLFGSFGISDERLALLRKSSLTCLVLNEDKASQNLISDSGLSFLRGMPLTTLNIFGSERINGYGVSSLVGLPLTDLFLDGCKSIDDQVLSYFKGMECLASLTLSLCRGVTDEGIRYLVGLPLTKLFLEWCPLVTEHSLELVQSFPSLKSLHLIGLRQITDWGLEKLVALSNLEELFLNNCNLVTNAGLVKLSELRSLQSLSIFRSRQSGGPFFLGDLPRLITSTSG